MGRTARGSGRWIDTTKGYGSGDVTTHGTEGKDWRLSYGIYVQASIPQELAIILFPSCTPSEFAMSGLFSDG